MPLKRHASNWGTSLVSKIVIWFLPLNIRTVGQLHIILHRYYLFQTASTPAAVAFLLFTVQNYCRWKFTIVQCWKISSNLLVLYAISTNIHVTFPDFWILTKRQHSASQSVPRCVRLTVKGGIKWELFMNSAGRFQEVVHVDSLCLRSKIVIFQVRLASSSFPLQKSIHIPTFNFYNSINIYFLRLSHVKKPCVPQATQHIRHQESEMLV